MNKLKRILEEMKKEVKTSGSPIVDKRKARFESYQQKELVLYINSLPQVWQRFAKEYADYLMGNINTADDIGYPRTLVKPGREAIEKMLRSILGKQEFDYGQSVGQGSNKDMI